MGKQKEGAVVNACIKWLFANGCFVWRHNTGAFRPPGSARPIYFGKKGSPDIIGLTRSGKFIGIECKAGSADLKDHQREFGELIKEKNGIYIVIYNSAEPLEEYKNIINPQ